MSRARRVYHFSYPTSRRSMRGSQRRGLDPLSFSYVDVHRNRGGDMFAALKSILLSTGKYTHGGLILNLPKGFHGGNGVEVVEEHPDLGSNPILILPNRPPLSDAQDPVDPYHPTRDRRILQSGSELEKRVLQAVTHVFEYVDRERAALSASAAKALPEEFLRYKEIEFGIKNDARVERFVETDEDPKGVTVAYLFAAPLDGGGRLLAAYGHGGYETLCWAEMLAENPHLVLEILESATSRSVNLILGEFVPSRKISHPLFKCDRPVARNRDEMLCHDGVLMTKVSIATAMAGRKGRKYGKPFTPRTRTGS